MTTKTRTIVRYRPLARARRRAAKMTIPLAVIAGLVPTAAFAAEVYRGQGIEGAAKAVTMRLTGYNPWVKQWIGSEFAAGWVPILAGVFAHKAANYLGINRALGRMGVPVLRV